MVKVINCSGKSDCDSQHRGKFPSSCLSTSAFCRFQAWKWCIYIHRVTHTSMQNKNETFKIRQNITVGDTWCLPLVSTNIHNTHGHTHFSILFKNCIITLYLPSLFSLQPLSYISYSLSNSRPLFLSLLIFIIYHSFISITISIYLLSTYLSIFPNT